ncbi:MAG: four helix bundle protein [Prevotella sp.]
MSDFGKILEEKTLNFSVRIYNMAQFLNKEKHEFRIADQIFRSGTSIGANFAEAQCAISRRDFLCKLYISLKECKETLYWLKLLYRTRLLVKPQFESINNDCEELMKILTTITKSVRCNIKGSNSSVVQEGIVSDESSSDFVSDDLSYDVAQDLDIDFSDDSTIANDSIIGDEIDDA